MRLSDDQECAVKSWERGDLCVVAGPGSGKTRVLVERVRWLILDRHVPPEQVLAITFTEKAAFEMRTRLVEEGRPSAKTRKLLEAARVSTIDAFCNRLIREHALRSGIDPGFGVLEEFESGELLRNAVSETLEESFSDGWDGMDAFLSSYASTAARSARADPLTLIDDLAALVRRARSYGQRPFLSETRLRHRDLANLLRALAPVAKRPGLEDIANRLDAAEDGHLEAIDDLLHQAAAATKPIAKRGRAKALVTMVKDDLLPSCQAAVALLANQPAREWLLRTTERAMERFAGAKRSAGRMDFDDILAAAADLLAARDGPSLSFRHVLIDEFQDTNPLQLRLVQRLVAAHGAEPPVRFVVGDINQSIYGFRHSDQNVFRDYRGRVEEGGGEVIRLVENFRTRQEILDAARHILPGGAGSGVERHQLVSGNAFPEKERPCLEVHVVQHGLKDAVGAEGEWLARRLFRLKHGLRLADRSGPSLAERAVEWGDIGVLVRTHSLAARLAAALKASGIPCRTRSGRSLFATPEVADLAAFLRVLRNPRDEISLASVLKSPLCGVGDATLLQLKRASSNLAEAFTGSEPFPAQLDQDEDARLRRFREVLAECRADRAIVPARLLLSRAITAGGYRAFVARREDGPQALSNIDRLLQWIGRREQQGTAGIDAVSEALELAREVGLASRDAPEKTADRQAVEVLTMHAAKGLEFPIVALASLQSGARGAHQSLQFSPKLGIGGRWRHARGDAPVADSAYCRAHRDAERLERQESDRLLYVAMTRAEEHLVLSASFAGKAQMRNWCKPVFSRLGLQPKTATASSPEVKTAGKVRFRYERVAGKPAPSDRPEAEVRLATPEALPPRAPSAQADYVGAVTSVALFAECPRRYYLSRHLGLEGRAPATAPRSAPPDPARPSGGMSAAEFGSQVHEYLAGTLHEPVPEAVQRVASRFREHELGRRAASASLIETEMAFVFAVKDRLLRGTIDLLFEEGGERILLDYKTDRVRPGREEVAARRHAAQLQIYAAGLAQSGQPADRAVVFYLRTGRGVDIDIGEPALNGARRLARRFFSAQEDMDFEPRPGPRCRFCPHYQAECPAEIP